MTLSTSCSLESHRASPSFTIDLSQLQNQRRLLEPPNGLSGGVSSFVTTGNGIDLPPHASQFACYGINVTGPGIAGLNPDPRAKAEEAKTFERILRAPHTSCNYPGILSRPVFLDGSSPEISLSIPPGSIRLVQLIGITDPAICARGAFGEEDDHHSGSRYFELGRAVMRDVFSDRFISMTLHWPTEPAERMARAVDCGDGGQNGPGNHLGTGVTSIVSTDTAFAALRADGTVIAWGDAAQGGAAVPGLQHVKSIHSTGVAFAALKHDGTVTAWGGPHGGNASAVQGQLVNVKEIHSNTFAFAALRQDGSVVTWGDNAAGGYSSPVQTQLTDVLSIAATDRAFAAVKSDGSVVTWGDALNGGDSSSVQSNLNDVRSAYSTQSAFAALKNDGSVVTWGASSKGGDSSSVQGQLSSVVSIQATGSAFAAVKSDGNVVTWGEGISGGDSSSVQHQLISGIQRIYSNSSAFAALKVDGSVVTWGMGANGGNSTSVQPALIGVHSIASNAHAFAALKSDGTVVAWGHAAYGGAAPLELGAPPSLLSISLHSETQGPLPSPFTVAVGSSHRFSLMGHYSDGSSYPIPTGIVLWNPVGDVTQVYEGDFIRLTFNAAGMVYLNSSVTEAYPNVPPVNAMITVN